MRRKNKQCQNSVSGGGLDGNLGRRNIFHSKIFHSKIFHSKKGVGVGQVFIFIVAAITFSLIMIFGYKAINSFLHSGEQVQFVQFKTDLESSIKKIYTEYGSIRKVQYHPPPRYRQICFVDMDYDNINKEMDMLCAADPVACDVWSEAAKGKASNKKGYDVVDENVFLSPKDSGLVAMKVHQISIYNEDLTAPKGFLCLPIIEGIFSLTLEGKGDHTELSKSS
jgi:hypothetical protein